MTSKKTPPTFEMPVDLGSEYHLLMSLMNVSVSKHKLDADFTVLWVNDRFYEMFGYTKAEYEACFGNKCSIYYQNDPDDWNILLNLVADTLSSGKRRCERIVRMRHRDGRRLWIRLASHITDEIVDGFQTTYSVMLDVTDQMQSLFEQSVTFENLPVGVSKYRVTKDSLVYIDGNERFKRFFNEPQRLDPMNQLDAASRKVLAQAHQEMCLRQPVSFLINTEITPSQKMWMSVSGECVDQIGEDPIYLYIHNDITEITEYQQQLKKSNSKLKELAYVDPITGGANANRFQLDAGKAVIESAPGSYMLICLNLQKFKLINDIANKEVGDQTLKYIYEQLIKHLKQGEYAARLESDNFALLLHAQAKEALQMRLNHMIEDLNRFNQTRARKYFLTFTAGAYQIEHPNIPMTQMQGRAHVARKGIHQVHEGLCTCAFYNDSDRLALLREKDMEDRMRDALKNEEFIIHLQPRLSLADQSIVGAEALVRWNDPGNGMIPPSSFIPLFEKNGFVVQLDLYVFERTCMLLRKWVDSGKSPVMLSVNMSRAHLSKLDFVEEYEKILKKYELPAQLLEIEITESMVVDNLGTLQDTVQKIHGKGFRCSIDDFGSGYSSLNVLKHIEVDTLKLDQGFIACSEENSSRNEAVIRSVVDLAKKLGMSTIAEGVETDPQLSLIRRSGCDEIQGYIFSRPLSIADFEKLLFKEA